MKDSPQPYLQVRDLTVRFDTEDGAVRAVNGLSFTVERGRTLGIVGESGSGKSVTGLTILGLHNLRRTTITGEILVADRNVVGLDDEEIRRLRGRDVAMIFQDPLSVRCTRCTGREADRRGLPRPPQVRQPGGGIISSIFGYPSFVNAHVK